MFKTWPMEDMELSENIKTDSGFLYWLTGNPSSSIDIVRNALKYAQRIATASRHTQDYFFLKSLP